MNKKLIIYIVIGLIILTLIIAIILSNKQNTNSNELEKILNGCDDEDIMQHKLDIMRGEAVNKKVGAFLQANVIPTIKAAMPMDDAASFIKKLRKNKYLLIINTYY